MSIPWDNLNEQQLAQLMEAYLLGTLTDEQIDKFEAGLLKRPGAADLCAEAIQTVAMTREVFRDDQEQRAILNRDETLESFHDLLAELGEAEERAETHLVHLVGHVKTRRPLWQQWPIVIPSAMAALLAIAVILIVMVPTGTPSSIVGNTPPKPADSAPPITVATLTASHNATWAEGASALGSALRTGQRLTLTAGFAEITTARGAIAILEAPATIELLDNNNALHLHTGKLVGICETDSSKGFVVRTPHMNVTDLGTRFGVNVADRTRVMVVEGEVEARGIEPAAHDRPIQLVAGDRATSDPLTGRVVMSKEPIDRLLMDWRGVSDAPHFEGDIRYEPTLPANLNVGVYEHDGISMFAERLSVQLDQPVPVTMVQPGTYETFLANGSILAKGAAVDSYLIHYDPTVDTNANIARLATIRFDRPILGVIADADSLENSDDLFALAGGEESEGSSFRGLDPKGPQFPGDIVRISDDRRTLRVELYVGTGIDQLRVLVQTREQEP